MWLFYDGYPVVSSEFFDNGFEERGLHAGIFKFGFEGFYLLLGGERGGFSHQLSSH